MLSDTVDRDIVHKMVTHFYATLLKDDLVSHYFIKALGDDLNNEKWKDHLNTLDNFWLMMMTGRGGYGGHPFPPHAFLGEMYPEIFERWLKLFNEAVHQFFTPQIAESFYKKSQILAKQFMENLDIIDD